MQGCCYLLCFRWKHNIKSLSEITGKLLLTFIYVCLTANDILITYYDHNIHMLAYKNDFPVIVKFSTKLLRGGDYI